jgi:hypothetical protein
MPMILAREASDFIRLRVLFSQLPGAQQMLIGKRLELACVFSVLPYMTEEKRPLESLGIQGHPFKRLYAIFASGRFRFQSLGFFFIKGCCNLVILRSSICSQISFEFGWQKAATRAGAASQYKVQCEYHRASNIRSSPSANYVLISPRHNSPHLVPKWGPSRN